MFAMLSLDLEKNISASQRDEFYDYLKQEQWVKVPKVTTTWYAQFNPTTSEAQIIEATRVDLNNAMKVSGVRNIEAVVNVSVSRPVTF